MLKSDIQSKVQHKCANYAGNGMCLYDVPCPFFDEKLEGGRLPRCYYYENAVLPQDDQLKARYWQSFGLAYWGESAKPCKRCENTFTPADKRQQYCASCQDIRRKAQQRQRKKRQRK